MRKHERKDKPKKVLISADGTPYTIWQERTRTLCLALLAWSVLELAAGIGLVSLAGLDIFHLEDFIPQLSVGPYTVASGAVNLIAACLGLWGAHNPKRITIFFWAVFLDALLSSWSTASAFSQGQLDLATTLSFIVVLLFAICAWNVRGQTGYFDNHPHPGDEDPELPLEKQAAQLKEGIATGVENAAKELHRVETGITEEMDGLEQAAERHRNA